MDNQLRRVGREDFIENQIDNAVDELLEESKPLTDENIMKLVKYHLSSNIEVSDNELLKMIQVRLVQNRIRRF